MTSSRKSRPSLTPHSSFIGAVQDEWQLFSDDPKDYSIGLPIGFGASSIVYTATYQPRGARPTPCALKVLDLDVLPPHSLRLLRRETQLMSLSKHPNVLRVRGSWVDGHKLYIALRLMSSGSATDVMRYGWPGGMEEEVVKCILKQALEGLNYLHINGFIHRDIKGANFLIDDDGTVLLGDLGVAASLSDDEAMHAPSVTKPSTFSPSSQSSSTKKATQPTHRIGKRKSFVGTPCWMAPELISGRQYDSKADIWSFGITALELTQGRAPRSREPPAQVLMRTVQDEPPSFDCERGQFKYSKAFKEIVESCLTKDPARRPTAAQLLDTPFFRSSKKKSFLVGAVLKNLPALVRRQERRSRPSDRSMHTFESWDFTTSKNSSPAPSASRRQRSAVPADSAVFEFEFEDDVKQAEDSADTSGDEESSSDPVTPELSLSSLPSPVTPLSPSSYTDGDGMRARYRAAQAGSGQSPRVYASAPVTPSYEAEGLSSFPFLKTSKSRDNFQSLRNGVWTKLKKGMGADDKEKGKQKSKTGALERITSRGYGISQKDRR